MASWRRTKICRRRKSSRFRPGVEAIEIFPHDAQLLLRHARIPRAKPRPDRFGVLAYIGPLSSTGQVNLEMWHLVAIREVC